MLLLIAAVGGVTLAARRPAPREAGAVGAFEVERPRAGAEPPGRGRRRRDAVRRRPAGSAPRRGATRTDARRRRVVPRGVGGPLRHRPLRRLHPPQPDHPAAVGRDHAERLEPGADLVRAATGATRPGRSSRSSSWRSPPPRSSSASASSSPWLGARADLDVDSLRGSGTDEHLEIAELDLPLRAARRRRGPDAGRLADLAPGRRLGRHRVRAASASSRRSPWPTSSTTSRSSTTTAPASTSSRSTRGRRRAASASRSTS